MVWGITIECAVGESQREGRNMTVGKGSLMRESEGRKEGRGSTGWIDK